MDFVIDLTLQDIINGDELWEELQDLAGEPLNEENLPHILDYCIDMKDSELNRVLWKENKEIILEILLDNYL